MRLLRNRPAVYAYISSSVQAAQPLSHSSLVKPPVRLRKIPVPRCFFHKAFHRFGMLGAVSRLCWPTAAAAALRAAVVADPPHLLHGAHCDDGRLQRSQRLNEGQVRGHALLGPRPHRPVDELRHGAQHSDRRRRHDSERGGRTEEGRSGEGTERRTDGLHGSLQRPMEGQQSAALRTRGGDCQRRRESGQCAPRMEVSRRGRRCARADQCSPA